MKKQKLKQLLLIALILLGTTALTSCQSDDVGEAEYEPEVVATLEPEPEEVGDDEIVEIVDEQDAELDDDEDELIDDAIEPEVISLSLGDTFQFGYFEVELGSEIQFVLYQWDERTDVPNSLGELQTFPASQREQFYLPVHITDMRDDPEMVLNSINQFSRPVYYRPDDTEPNASLRRSPAIFDHELLLLQLEDETTISETYFQFEYSEDGQYRLHFRLREDGFDSEIIKVFELLIDIEWSEAYRIVTIEHINQPAGESFQVGNFQVVVGSEVTLSERSGPGLTIHYFPVTVTNIGYVDEHLSSLNLSSHIGQSGFHSLIDYIVFEGEEIPLQQLLPLSPGMWMSFQLPVYRTTCSTLNQYRDFRFAERVTNPTTNNITIRYHHSFACVRYDCSLEGALR